MSIRLVHVFMLVLVDWTLLLLHQGCSRPALDVLVVRFACTSFLADSDSHYHRSVWKWFLLSATECAQKLYVRSVMVSNPSRATPCYQYLTMSASLMEQQPHVPVSPLKL
eukprot:3177009-Amphidinium_carterae.1